VEAFAGDCSDEALFLAAVADRLADRIDMTGRSRFRDKASAPHCVQQVVFSDDALAILHQIDQQVEDLGPDRNRLGSPGQLPSVGVEHVASEYELHFDAH